MMSSHQTDQPFFTVAIPTFRRLRLLAEAVRSCTGQSFSDFEIIISNDDPLERIDPLQAGLLDPRIRLFNNETNLGPIGNQNRLIQLARGKYFIFLSDDDLFHPDLLQTAHEQIRIHSFPSVLFPSYCSGNGFSDDSADRTRPVKALSGAAFLQGFLSREIRPIAWYGIFRKDFLQDIGGMRKFGKGRFSHYSDNLVAIEAGRLPKVIYIDRPLIFFRVHDGSASRTIDDPAIFLSAQEDMIGAAVPVLRTPPLSAVFDRNLFSLLKWLIEDYVEVCRRSGAIRLHFITDYLRFLRTGASHLKGRRYRVGLVAVVLTRLCVAVVTHSRQRLKTITAGHQESPH